MRALTIAIITLLILSMMSCTKDAEFKVSSTNNNFEVEQLFTTNGITVYRFVDNGKYHYFTKNETSQQISCGKNCTREEVIPHL